ncbi:MAG TPA: type I polyketide synthase [Gemmataceae bacterium]|nr:type I polyketide synthase [Gemmataceae bacterium]
MLFVNARKEQPEIAVVGLGCWYPGARGPQQLWENILTRRREFRRLPDNRLPLSDYHDPDRTTPDKTYGRRAAVLDGFEFDWAKWRIPQATYETTDIVQWLALEVANLALENAGFQRDSIVRDRTGVIVGNTLTGEHTRSQSMRLRWPFVKRALLAAAAARGLTGAAAEELAKSMEELYKSVFAPVTEDTLAGGLSNTIAGRICNFFDFHGGGYTVDGACSSSLLAVCTAANMLNDRDVDMALAGGVDISLDTFELIGFAKTGALSPDEMRVYDKRGNGFIPGEGCGFVVMKRLEDARAAGDTVYAVLRGWGVSSDGKGGLTAPKVEGQATALRRAYERAGYSPATLDFIEGHGTGTRVGDKVELEAIATALSEAGVETPRSVGVTSFKSIMGHCKAAAGVGAFLKAVIAANRRVLPPTAGCTQPNPVFESTARTLYPIRQGRIAGPDRKLRIGVSAMGFGGINAHVTLESGDPPAPSLAPSVEERALLAAHQETELFVLDADSVEELCDRLPDLADTAERLSQGELTDLAAHLSKELSASRPIRAAVIAANPDELAANLRALEQRLQEAPPDEGEIVSGPQREWWVSNAVRQDRVGFLCPGQGSQQLAMARVLVERFPWARELAARADAWLAEVGSEPVTPLIFRALDRAADADELQEWNRTLARTEIAQPAICLASLLHVRYLARLGVHPSIVGGHSLGELTAFHLAGAFDEETLIKLAALRGRAMASSGDDSPAGAMVSLACSREEAESLLRGLPGYAVVANINSPRQTVVSGEEDVVRQVMSRAEARGIVARGLPVSNAFHSRLVAAAAHKLRDAAPVPDAIAALKCRLVSSMTGRLVESSVNLREHFATQVTARVDFVGTANTMAAECDQLIEVGPGRVLSGLTADTLSDGPACLPVAGQPDADRDLNIVLARAFALGVDVSWDALYEGRLVRDFVPASERNFIDNPCERDFPELPFEPLPASGAGALESFLVENTGYEPDQLREYLARRQGFLANIVQADIYSLNGSLMKLPPEHPAQPFVPTPRLWTIAAIPEKPEPKIVAAPTPTTPTPTAPAVELEDLLLDLAAKRTGFPKDTITMEVRLLDDLNLDSIKAAELVAAAAKQVGAAGKVDPSKLANATLAEVAAAIRDAMGGAMPSAGPGVTAPEKVMLTAAPDILDDGPSWVRNFVIEYAEAA